VAKRFNIATRPALAHVAAGWTTQRTRVRLGAVS
jgi:hypothetical protein